MCMWQSAALAGAFTLAGPVPVVFGTACWARPAVASSVPVTAAAAAAVKNVRRPMAWSLIDFPPVMLLPGLALPGPCKCTPIRSHEGASKNRRPRPCTAADRSAMPPGHPLPTLRAFGEGREGVGAAQDAGEARRP